MTKVTIIIVTWNSLRFVEDCLTSLSNQTYKNFSVLVIDNNSKDGTVQYIRTHHPYISLLENFKNIGYSKANNQGIKISKSEYILTINPDIILDKDFLFHCIPFADGKVQGGSFGGKLLKFFIKDLDPSEHSGGIKTPIFSKIIDSVGLAILKDRRAINIGEGQNDTGQYEKVKEVFGFSGACVLYRSQALDDTMIRGEYFDQNFFSYKEDVDLAWRLQLYGWESWYNPLACAYHHRTYGISPQKNLRNLIQARTKISKDLRFLSLRNHHLMIVKNEFLSNIIIHLFPIIIRELKIIIYSLFFEPRIFIRALLSFFRELPYTLIKRKIIMNRRKVDFKKMKYWFFH